MLPLSYGAASGSLNSTTSARLRLVLSARQTTPSQMGLPTAPPSHKSGPRAYVPAGRRYSLEADRAFRKGPSAKSGTVSPNEMERTLVVRFRIPGLTCFRSIALPQLRHYTAGPRARLRRDKPALIFIPACSSRAFHLATVSNTLSPSDRFADSVATGYHATYPMPRTAVNDLPIWSQSLCRACSSGIPIRVSLVASSGMMPSYPISNSTMPLAADFTGQRHDRFRKQHRCGRCPRCRAER